MVWRKVFGKHTEPEPTRPTGPEISDEEREMPPGARLRSMPPHLEQAIHRRAGAEPPGDPAQRRLNALRRQREAILYDIEQGELAAAGDNPWTARIALLTEAMTTVSADLTATAEIAPGPWSPVPDTPITIGEIEAGDVSSVAFAIGDNQFAYSEDPDWAERGHQITRTELVRRSGDVAALVPDDTPDMLRMPLRDHLEDSLFVFASNLRDRVLDGEELPGSPTLADLARPCPICGGWTDWHGTCQACARRNAAIADLKREERRLLDERNREAEERHRLVEGLPLARKRLRDVEADLARLGERRP